MPAPNAIIRPRSELSLPRPGAQAMMLELRDGATKSLGSLMAYDLAVGMAACATGWQLPPMVHAWYYGVSATSPLAAPYLLAPLFALALVGTGVAAGLYERTAFRSPAAAILPSLLASVTTATSILILSRLAALEVLNPWVILLTISGSTASLALPRAAMSLGTLRARRRVVYVGSSLGAALLRHRLENTDDHDSELVFALEDPTFYGQHPATLAGLFRQARGELLVLEQDIPAAVLHQATVCVTEGIRVMHLGAFHETTFGEVPPECLRIDWVTSLEASQSTTPQGFAKRVADISFSVGLLLLTLPAWPLVALLVHTTSRGPVFYSQERVGKGGRRFTLYKFRSMSEDAEADGRAVFAQEGDTRVTRVGWWLRKLRIDELPQLWNVLQGDMSLVGPRPERPEFVAAFEDELEGYRLRHIVKPGLTGWAQVNYRYGASRKDTEAKLRYDLYYVKHGGFLLDLWILFRTAGVLAEGSR